jgi:lipoate-protein ligase A
MWFYNLGHADWREAITITSALAALRRSGAVLARPWPPTLCVGDLVNLDQVVDAESCLAHGFPVVGSKTRTNALCLAKEQLELRVVLPRGEFATDDQDAGLLRIVLAPFLLACRELGIRAEYKAPREIVTRGRRIAVACKGEMNGCDIVSASLAVDFDADTFAEILHAPNENLRARAGELVHARRTCLREELSALPLFDALEERVCSHMRLIAGGPEQSGLDDAMQSQMRMAAANLPAPLRAHRANGASGDWDVDIGAGTELQQRTCSTPGGFVRATCEWHDGRIVSALLEGNFICHPPGCLQRMEQALVGAAVGQVASKVCSFYRDSGWVTPGIQPGHWTRVLLPLSLEDYAPAQPAHSPGEAEG